MFDSYLSLNKKLAWSLVMRTLGGISCLSGSSIVQFSSMGKTMERDFFCAEVDDDGEFKIDHVNVYVILSTPFADEISKQVCALKMAISIGKGQGNLIYIYEEYNSVS